MHFSPMNHVIKQFDTLYDETLSRSCKGNGGWVGGGGGGGGGGGVKLPDHPPASAFNVQLVYLYKVFVSLLVLVYCNFPYVSILLCYRLQL